MEIFNKNIFIKKKGFKNTILYYSSFQMNDWELYELYCSLPLATINDKGKIYPKYVKIIGRSCMSPHPHRHFTFEKFITCLYGNNDFRKILNDI